LLYRLEFSEAFAGFRNDILGAFMQFDTKIVVVIRTDLQAWQKLNVAAFLASGIAAAFPECIGEAYEDASATRYLSLIGQPILIYGAPDRTAMSRALERGVVAQRDSRGLYRGDVQDDA
jgi:hypothetical protein